MKIKESTITEAIRKCEDSNNLEEDIHKRKYNLADMRMFCHCVIEKIEGGKTNASKK